MTAISVSFRDDPDCRLPKECLGPIEPRPGPINCSRLGRAGRAAGNPAVPVPRCVPRSAGSGAQGSAGSPQDCDAAPDVCIGSVCSLPLLPVPTPAQPSPAQFIIVLRPSFFHHPWHHPHLHHLEPQHPPHTLRYPDLVILQAVITLVGPCGRALFPSPDCQPLNPRTCTGGSRNSRPSNNPSDGLPKSCISVSQRTTSHTTKYLNMATRGPPGARGMGNRFAQFKLVLLGMFLQPEWRRPKLGCVRVLTTPQESLLSERYCPSPLPSNTPQHRRR